MNSIQPHVCLHFEQCVTHILFTLRLVSKKINKAVCDVVEDVIGPNMMIGGLGVSIAIDSQRK